MIESRKQAHLDICLQDDVEHGNTRLEEIHLVHYSLPDFSLSEVDISTHFLFHNIAAPIFISCMTGGSKDGSTINMRLAEAAETLKVPLGLGSMRILFEQEECIPDFSLKHIAPNVPILANLGAVQLRFIPNDDIYRMLETIGADALVLHINPAQEISQIEGTTDFHEVLSSIRHFTSLCPIPVIIKEVGYGISPSIVDTLLGYGIKFIDIAGSGGTNWVKVEDLRNIQETQQANTSLYKLGHPTALLMLALYNTPNILSSGGIRDAMDIARCLVLGAKMVGMALPVIQKASISTQEVVDYLQNIINELRKILLLCNARKTQEITSIPFWIESNLQHDLYSFCKAQNITLHPKIQSLLMF